MKILVTGAAGFIGSHTSERLHSLGHEVIGLDNFNPYYSLELKNLNTKALTDKGISIIKADLRDDNLAQQLPTDINYIFHFAAQPGISKTSTFEDYLTNNVIATRNLIDYALQCPDLKLMVNVGTSSIYGLEATYPESIAPKPASFYGVTKLAAEQLVLQKSREKQFSSCSLRLYSVIGPRERPEKMYTKLIANALNYVGDIVDGVVSVIGKESVVDGEIFNLGTEAENSTKEGIEAVEKVLGQKIDIEVVEARAGDQLRTCANIDKARKLLDYNPTTTLLEGVTHQVNWYKENFL